MRDNKKDPLSFEKAVSKAQKHRLIHQYTTFSALEKIINNKSLLLTRIDLLNDTVENKKTTDLWKNKIFVSCFTNFEYESFFFWTTYAKNSRDGVMISFRPSSLNNLSIHPDEKCLETPLPIYKKSDYKEYSLKVSAENWAVFDNSLIDIMYIPRNYDTEGILNHQGRLKYTEWSMEQETRVRIALRPKRCEIDANMPSNTAGYPYIKPENQKLYAKLPIDCLANMIITLSPFANKNLKEKIAQLLAENNIKTAKIKTSSLTNETFAKTRKRYFLKQPKTTPSQLFKTKNKKRGDYL